MKKSRKKSRRSFARRNPAKRTKRRRSAMRSVLFLNSPRKKKRRGGFSRRNPARRMGKRRSFSRRNPSGGGPIETLFSQDMLIIGGGVVAGNLGTSLVLNKLLLPDASGKVPLALPGVDTTKPGYMQSLPVAIYRLAIGCSFGYFLKDRAPRFAQGVMIGSVAGAISDVVKRSNLLAMLPGGSAAPAAVQQTAGANAFLPNGRNGRGASTWVAGVDPIFTGPGTQFIPNRTNRPRVGAVVTRRWMDRTTAGVPNFARPN